jgi:hypothetical protein
MAIEQVGAAAAAAAAAVEKSTGVDFLERRRE